MSIGLSLAVAAVYAAYSGCFYVIDWLFAHGHPRLAAVAAGSALLVNWAAAAVATSGHRERVGNLLWLLFGAVIPFLGGAGLALFGNGGSHRSTGYALMVGTLLPVVVSLYIGAGYLRGRLFRSAPPPAR
ncbi:MAG TPA: hypothetical protein DCM05_13390 [Elusimicrobia bacterium]|nr:hypothetical protein [Elusimicrobiota bacterium]